MLKCEGIYLDMLQLTHCSVLTTTHGQYLLELTGDAFKINVRVLSNCCAVPYLCNGDGKTEVNNIA